MSRRACRCGGRPWAVCVGCGRVICVECTDTPGAPRDQVRCLNCYSDPARDAALAPPANGGA